MARARSSPRLVLFTVALWGGGLALGLAAAGNGVLDGDVEVTRRVQSWDGTLVEMIASFGNWIGHFWVGLVIALPLLALLVWWRRWREATFLAAVFVLRALNNPVKEVFDSPRPTPDLVLVTEQLETFGFPSGHASGTLLTFGALILLSHRLALPPATRLGLWVTGVISVVATCFGRIHVGAHWPSDVIGGVIFGLAALLTLAWAFGLISSRQSHGYPAVVSGRIGN
jgi:membrane-associated phospholipid phosphatase